MFLFLKNIVDEYDSVLVPFMCYTVVLRCEKVGFWWFASKAQFYIIFVIFSKGAAAAPKRPAKFFKLLILAFEVKMCHSYLYANFLWHYFLTATVCTAQLQYIVQNKTPNHFLPGEVPLR